jgi:hypothetical protein
MFFCRDIKISTLHKSVGALCIRASTTEARNIGRILKSWNSICSNPCFAKYSSMKFTALVGIMGGMLASSAEDSWVRDPIESNQTIELICAASLRSTQHYGKRTNTCWLGIRIMCPSGTTWLSANC